MIHFPRCPQRTRSLPTSDTNKYTEHSKRRYATLSPGLTTMDAPYFGLALWVLEDEMR